MGTEKWDSTGIKVILSFPLLPFNLSSHLDWKLRWRRSHQMWNLPHDFLCGRNIHSWSSEWFRLSIRWTELPCAILSVIPIADRGNKLRCVPLQKSCLVFLSILLIVVHQSVVTWMANKHTRTDRSKVFPLSQYRLLFLSQGQLRIMVDNYPLDTYKYIVVVDTGYKMFATTDSEVNMEI